MKKSIPSEIIVGIPTLGEPVISRINENLTSLENMVIGKSFHWEQVMQVNLPGKVEITDNPDFRVRNTLPLEQYLECVVGSEMNPEAPLEFLKAHAIISRSWVVGKILDSHLKSDEGKVNNPEMLIGWDDTGSHHDFHVCSDDHCQRYQGIQPISQEAENAIRSTAGLVLRNSSGDVIDARFSKCCGGMTERFSSCWQNIELPSLESFKDPWCDLSSLPEDKKGKILQSVLKDYDLATKGGYRWKETISKEKIRKNLSCKFNRDIGKILSLTPLKRGDSGRITLMEIRGENGILKIGKELWIRRLLSESHLFSSAFDIFDKGDYFYLKGKGWGHGVGLCQIGAARMAYEGYNFKEILQFYYPGAIVGQ